jgi:hypothetical protein
MKYEDTYAHLHTYIKMGRRNEKEKRRKRKERV